MAPSSSPPGYSQQSDQKAEASMPIIQTQQAPPEPDCYCPRLKTHWWFIKDSKEREEEFSVQEIEHGKAEDVAKADVVILSVFILLGAVIYLVYPVYLTTTSYAKGDIVRKCHKCKQAFKRMFKIPSIWFTTLSRRSNGYFGYEDILETDADANKTTRAGTISWARFLMKYVQKSTDQHSKEPINYRWVKLNAFTRWHAPSGEYPRGRTEIILFDHMDFARKVGDALIDKIKIRELGDPFWVYPIMAEEIAAFQDDCVWESRNLIRSHEKQRSLHQDLLVYLHEASRHSIHINETLSVAESTLGSMQRYHDHFISTEPDARKKGAEGTVDYFSKSIQNRLGHLQTTIAHLRHRAVSNHERIKTEISLSYNKFAQVDSSSTKSISLIGLLFLPAAFVASIFSSSFFNYDAPTGIWGVSNKFWIYWAVTLPVTFVTIFLWFLGPTIWVKLANSWHNRVQVPTRVLQKLKAEGQAGKREEKENMNFNERATEMV